MLPLTYLVCVGIGLGILACLIFRATWTGVLVLVLAAVWEPLNNDRLEGAILYTADPGHGLTMADLLGLAGFLAGLLTLTRPWRAASWHPGTRRRTLLAGAGSVAIFAAGIAVAWITG